ncbi:MAG: JDVT-CTERM system glutamic-type intramembrane protease [Gammaproteobacteria bacterium]|nr:JDVT-CTERM system glutamic-type intramembrane protease [Gammaproteobacteria bacterium]
MVVVSNKYLKDPHWYLAFVVAIGFWVVMDIFIQPATPRNLFSTPEIILVSIILYPILEEIVFRGLVQGLLLMRVRYQKVFFGLSGANVVTSILFSVLHLVHQAPLMAFLIFFPSLIFGYFRDRHRSILPSIWLHSFYNAGFLMLFVVD